MATILNGGDHDVLASSGNIQINTSPKRLKIHRPRAFLNLTYLFDTKFVQGNVTFYPIRRTNSWLANKDARCVS